MKDRLVARHTRRWDKHKVIFEPIHYLALLERKPGAFDFARPLEGWQLPECFPELRRRLEGLQEGSKGTREYIKVLRLLESATLKELTVAVQEALHLRITGYEAVRLILEYRREQGRRERDHAPARPSGADFTREAAGPIPVLRVGADHQEAASAQPP